MQNTEEDTKLKEIYINNDDEGFHSIKCSPKSIDQDLPSIDLLHNLTGSISDYVNWDMRYE